MEFEGTALHEPMVRLQIQGGSYPHQRRSRTELRVRQSQLSQTIQRIHRFGGKILEVQQVSVRAEALSSDRTDRSSERQEIQTSEAVKPQVHPQVDRVEKSKPLSPVYSLFPHGKVDSSKMKPVRRPWVKPLRKGKRPYRQLSLGKQRRQFFRSQALKRRRRR